jgi:hypothetical protein
MWRFGSSHDVFVLVLFLGLLAMSFI